MFKRAAVTLMALFFAVGVQAATLNETDLAGGFSSNANSYTQVGSGFDEIEGTLLNGEDDFLQFTDLAAGAQTVSFTFELLSNANNAQASGRLRYFESFSSNPFSPGTAVGDFNLNPRNNTSQTLSFSLPTTFAGGDLFVAVLSFSSNGLPYSYSASVPGNAAAPAPVPVPATGLMLLAALAGALMFVRRSTPHLVGA